MIRPSLALLLPALALALPAKAVEITVTPETPSVGEAFRLTISGVWRDGCIPFIKEVEVSKGEILVLAEPSGEICTLALTPFELEVPPVPLQRIDAGVYRVSFLIDDRAATGRISEEASLLFEITSPELSRIVPESGAWWPEPGGLFNSSGPGVGLSLEVQGNTLVATLNAYSEDGSPEWWIAAGTVGQRIFRSQRLRVSGGQSLFSPYQPIQETQTLGNLSIDFLSPSQAELWLERPAKVAGNDSYRSQAISISRFLFASQPGAESWVGSWVVSLDDAQGSSQRIRFEETTWNFDGRSYQLVGQGGAVVLDCELVDQRHDVLPRRCLLNHPTLPAMELDQVGLRRLAGRASDGSEAVLLRLDP